MLTDNVAVRRWRTLPAEARDGLLGLLLALVAFVPPLASAGTRLGELPHRPVDALAVAAALAQTLPLTWRRRWPGRVLALAAVGFAIQDLRGYGSFAGLGLLIAIYSAGAHQKRFRRLTAAGASVGYVALAAGLRVAGSANRFQDYAIFFAFLAGGWLLGAWVRLARASEAERRRLAAAEARAAERSRIARELHDVVTHHVTAMVVQAGAAQFLTAQPERVAENLNAIGETGRHALTELRDLLGVLDPHRGAVASAPRDRQPGLDRIAELVERTREAGQPVELAGGGPGDLRLGAGRELAAYRVVQEALTNVLKYAPGGRTVVTVAADPEGIEIDVVNGAGTGPVTASGSGRGLAGLRERVEVFGGELRTGARPGGGFAVHARIPAGERA